MGSCVGKQSAHRPEDDAVDAVHSPNMEQHTTTAKVVSPLRPLNLPTEEVAPVRRPQQSRNQAHHRSTTLAIQHASIDRITLDTNNDICREGSSGTSPATAVPSNAFSRPAVGHHCHTNHTASSDSTRDHPQSSLPLPDAPHSSVQLGGGAAPLGGVLVVSSRVGSFGTRPLSPPAEMHTDEYQEGGIGHLTRGGSQAGKGSERCGSLSSGGIAIATLTHSEKQQLSIGPSSDGLLRSPHESKNDFAVPAILSGRPALPSIASARSSNASQSSASSVMSHHSRSHNSKHVQNTPKRNVVSASAFHSTLDEPAPLENLLKPCIAGAPAQAIDKESIDCTNPQSARRTMFESVAKASASASRSASYVDSTTRYVINSANASPRLPGGVTAASDSFGALVALDNIDSASSSGTES